MKKKLRRMGDITLDLEKILEEMSFDHDMQHQEVMAQVWIWLKTHAPGQEAEYLDGTHPEFYIGPARSTK